MTFATLEAPALANAIRVVGFRGTERLCRPYQFEIFAQVEGQAKAADLEEAIASAAKLTLQRDEEQPQFFQGMLGNVSLVQQMPTWALYRLELVPRVWPLGLTRHSRVFTKQSVPDIIESVLEGAGLGAEDFELRLDGDYPEEELVVQYAESDLDFLHRWMEREGLYYFFEQGDGGERLVIVDHVSFHKPLVERAVRYHPLAGHDASAGECFDTFAAIRAATVGRVKLADYDYARPMLDVSADQRVSERGFDEIRVHAGRFFDPAQAKRFARIRAEELKARELIYHAAGTALHMSAGYLVALSDHASDGFNKDYLLTEVHHFCNQLQQEGDSHLARVVTPEFEELYRVEVKAADASQPYRAPEATPKPRVMGFEGAVVDGPADSQYAQLDDQGRYLVKFRFDESDLPDGKRSTYVRMMQPYGGTTEGFHFPLRKGTEVMVAFDGGDPDRPFIAGAIPNMHTPSPVTQENQSWNVIQTSSRNRIRVNDEEGHEYIDISTPYDKTIFAMGYPTSLKGFGDPPHDVEASVFLGTQGTAAFFFGGDWEIEVSGEKKELIRSGASEKYVSYHNTKVVGPRVEEVSEQVVELYDGPHHTRVNGPRTDIVNNAVDEKYDSLTTTVAGSSAFKAADHAVDVGPYELRAGDSTLTQGATKMTWGATTGTIASLNLTIPGGATITAPNCTWVDSSQKNAAAEYLVSAGLKVNSASVAVSNYGGTVEATGYKIATVGVSVNVTGMTKNNQPAILELNASSIKQAAANMITCGLYSIL